jgi:hypothetical protein
MWFEAQMALRRLMTVALPLLSLLILTPFAAVAQNQAAAPAAPLSEQLLKPEELDALVAPVALYPDNLLSLVLMASTYPLEVVVADRWTRENKNLKGDQLKAAVDKRAWDDSVKSLVATSDVLSMMSSKIDMFKSKNLAVIAIILIIGLGGTFAYNGMIPMFGLKFPALASAAVAGIVFNLILSIGDKEETPAQ